ncbi:MAG: M1 family aminopeptidase [Bacteroidota bacterium]
MHTPVRLLTTFLALLFFTGLLAQRKHDLHFGSHITDAPVIWKPRDGAEKMIPCDNSRSDSVDILNYAIDLDLRDFGNSITSNCTITFTAKQDDLDFLPLDLLRLNVDSVIMGSNQLSYDYDDLLLNVHLPTTMNIGDTSDITVFYHGQTTPDPFWGGFKYDQGVGYNLGIGLSSDPFPMGRSWYPCFDNFVERSSYDISITTGNGRAGYAIGDFLGEEDLGNGDIKRSYRFNEPNPTYLTAVAAANYIEQHDVHSGAYGDYAILLVGRPADAATMPEAFKYLPQAIDAMERWFGAYSYDQVGFIMTPQGAMEHSELIAYPFGFLDSPDTLGIYRLMAHELAHMWWGNTMTLSCPENMWIKEGNGEYAAYLFYEYTFGREFFIDRLKDKHASVIRTAHTDDGGIYHPLSGIPQEYTYGTHTYDKGATAMHNLRTYLGDDLFSSAMTSLLEANRFSAIDAQQMQEQLTTFSGIDMSHFFNNWIYQPGFASYEIDSVLYEPNGNEWNATVHVQQKLSNAITLHTNTPMEITFFDENFNAHHAQFMVSGEFSEATVSVPFLPKFFTLNDRHLLNLGRLQDRITIKEAGDFSLSDVGLDNAVNEVLEMPAGDSAMLNVIHHYIAPDPEPTLPELQLSNTHYWSVGGIIPGGFKMKSRVFFQSASPTDLDHDLLQNGTDDLILVWRPNTTTPWAEYPYYAKQNIGSFAGRITIDDMLPGEYAFAVGDAPIATSVADVRQDLIVDAFPNPSVDFLNVNAVLPASMDVHISVYDALGQRALTSTENALGGQLNTSLDVSDLPSGIYSLEITGEEGAIRSVEQFVKK